jgi:hypothetical protein
MHDYTSTPITLYKVETYARKMFRGCGSLPNTLDSRRWHSIHFRRNSQRNSLFLNGRSFPFAQCRPTLYSESSPPLPIQSLHSLQCSSPMICRHSQGWEQTHKESATVVMAKDQQLKCLPRRQPKHLTPAEIAGTSRGIASH